MKHNRVDGDTNRSFVKVRGWVMLNAQWAWICRRHSG